MPELTLSYLRSQIVGIDQTVTTPFGERLITYGDYTASGRSLEFVERYLYRLTALYANSHTEDDATGRITTHLLHEAESCIKQAVNAGEQGRLIACGSGATAAIDRMQQIIGVKLPPATRLIMVHVQTKILGEKGASDLQTAIDTIKPVVFVGPYEHHSNEISWREGFAEVVEVQLTEAGELDLAHLESLLTLPQYQGRLRIGSFSAASNVTGMRTPVHEVARLLHAHDCLAFFDYAACAPYVQIDMNPQGDPSAALDAIFISPHKFIGGPGSSGILVFNAHCYHQGVAPSVAGGGTVDYVGPEDHDFIQDIETRERAGTPGILQIWKAALAFKVKQAVGVEVIEQREQEMTSRAFERWRHHPQIEILGNPDPEKRIGIVSFNIRDRSGQYLHPRFVTALLNDLFGLQTRAGCSCAGPYGHRLLGIDHEKAESYRAWIHKGYNGIKPGWCRLSFHYLFDDSEFEFILDTIEFIAAYGHLFVPQYRFDTHGGSWHHSEFQEGIPDFSLEAAINPPQDNTAVLSPEMRRARYADYLRQALILAEALEGERDDDVFISPLLGDLQFFTLRKENIA